MDRISTTAGTSVDYGFGAIRGEVLWEEVCILGSVGSSPAIITLGPARVLGTVQAMRFRKWADTSTGWGKWMEWQYPVRVVITDKNMFRAAGLVETVASL